MKYTAQYDARSQQRKWFQCSRKLEPLTNNQPNKYYKVVSFF